MPYSGTQRAMTAPIILTAEMGKDEQGWATGLRRAHFPPERNHLDAHITLFHHLPPTHLPEIKALAARLASEYPPPDAWLSDVMLLGRGVAYRIDSPELDAIRAEMADILRGLLVPQDMAPPRLHITVQNKVEPSVAKALHQKLAAEFRPRPFAITGLATHYYRGGPWESIARWSFRGR